MDAVAALYADGADYVNFFGDAFKGVPAIQAAFAEINSTVYKGSKIEIETVAVSFIKPDVVVTDSTWKLTGIPAGAPPLPTEGQSTVVAVKQGDGWKIVAHRARVPQWSRAVATTSYASPGGGFASAKRIPCPGQSTRGSGRGSRRSRAPRPRPGRETGIGSPGHHDDGVGAPLDDRVQLSSCEPSALGTRHVALPWTESSIRSMPGAARRLAPPGQWGHACAGPWRRRSWTR